MEKQNKYDYFYKRYEYKQNKRVLRVLSLSLLSGPMIIFAKIVGIFSNSGILFILHLIAVYLTGCLLATLILKNHPFSSIVKYIIIFTMEYLIFVMSISRYFEIGITYTLIPLISCIYLNKKFTRQITIITYIFMIISFIFRASAKDVIVKNGLTKLQWFLAMTSSYSLEYILNTFVLHMLAFRNHSILEQDVNSVTKQLQIQSKITSSYVNLLNQKKLGNESHPQNCSRYVRIICTALSRKPGYSKVLTEEYINYMQTAAFVHDIGYMVIPDRILNKKEPLTELEKQQLRLHTTQGEILFRENMENVDKEYLAICCDIILYHHEQWNGQGYPQQLAESGIPLSARIMYAANTLDNLLEGSKTRAPVSFDKAFEIIKRMGGREIDPVIAQTVYESKRFFRQAQTE